VHCVEWVGNYCTVRKGIIYEGTVGTLWNVERRGKRRQPRLFREEVQKGSGLAAGHRRNEINGSDASQRILSP
jgi:hypothetical protein